MANSPRPCVGGDTDGNDDPGLYEIGMLCLTTVAVNDAVAKALKEQPQIPSNLINVAGRQRRLHAEDHADFLGQ